jgi:hypothetical protein
VRSFRILIDLHVRKIKTNLVVSERRR